MFKHQRRYLAAWVLWSLSSAPAAYASALTLDQALTTADHYSAQISANQHQISAFQDQAVSAAQLPDPQVKFGIDNLPVSGGNAHRFTRDDMTMERVGIMQNYVSSDKRQRKADTLLAEAGQTQADNSMIRSQLQSTTAAAWLDLALLQQGLQQARQLAAESAKQLGVQRAGVASGASLPSSMIEARLVLAETQDSVTLAERDQALAQARLRQLTGISAVQTEGSLPRYERLPADPAVLQQAIDQHPAVIQANSALKVEQARVAQAAVASKPDVGVEVYYGKRASGREDMGGVMFTVDLPLFTANRQDKDYSAAVSNSLAAKDQLNQQVREQQSQLDSLLAQYQAAHDLWQRQTQDVLPLQRQRMAVITAQYRAGQSDLAAVLTARRDLLNSQLNANNAARSLAQLWATLRYLTPQEPVQ